MRETPVLSFSSRYDEFEATFRGDASLISQRLSVYLPLVNLIDAEAGRRALDLGAGRGEWLRLLTDKGWQAVGVDSNASMVENAKEAGINVVLGDMLDYLSRCEDDSIALISAFHVVEHIPIDVLMALLGSIKRVLAPGGLLILETPNPENLNVASWSFHLDPTHNHPLPPTLLQFLVKQAGLAGATSLRLNGGGIPENLGHIATALAELFQSSMDHAVLATKQSGEAGAAMVDRIHAFVVGRGEGVPFARMMVSLLEADAEMADLRRRVLNIESKFSKINVFRFARLLSKRLSDTNKSIGEAVDIARKALRKSEEARYSAEVARLQARASNERLAEIISLSSWDSDHAPRTFGARFSWVRSGAEAWVRMKPGSRPYRIAKRLAVDLYSDNALDGPLARAARSVMSMVPKLELRAKRVAQQGGRAGFHTREIADLLDQVIWEPESVQTAFVRLSAVASSLQPGQRKSNAASRPRLAFVSPVKPAKSGVADYSVNLLPALANHYEITVVVDQENAETTIEGVSFEVVELSWFKQNAAQFDRILYHFGNSILHTHMIELIWRYPGVVAMHDASTADLFAGLELTEGWTDFWSHELQRSHGYEAVQSRMKNLDLLKTVLDYPANWRILQDAQGVVVHSAYAKGVFEQHFSPQIAGPYRVLGLARPITSPADRSASRTQLGLGEKLFVACSMGSLNQHKCVDRLVEAWALAGLHKDEDCRLIFVGEAPPSEYTDALMKQISAFGASVNVEVTGYATPERYEAYLGAADCLIQLRSDTRGESSGALIDGLGAGQAVILNAHGAMAETPSDVAIVLPDRFEIDELAAALVTLRHDPDLRRALGERALDFIARNHAPDVVAEGYRSALEAFAEEAPAVYSIPKLREIVAAPDPHKREADRLLQIARRIAPPYAARRPMRRLLVDVSAVAITDIRTGIQRVVRSQLLGLMNNPPAGFRTEPVMLNYRDGRWIYEHAHDYACALLDLPVGLFPPSAVDVAAGDVLYVADFAPDRVVAASEQGLYADWRAKGVSINVAIYDILPITLPQYFPEGAQERHEAWLERVAADADRLVCISEATAEDTRNWLASRGASHSPPAVVAVPLGADLAASVPTCGVPVEGKVVLARIREAPTFVMVGTIEPRKGHLQAIRAFELLWSEGVDVQLLVIGSEGWKDVPVEQKRTIPDILHALRQRSETGGKLMWIADASDEYLDALYGASACLLAASEGEGFGLPLVEAARLGLPILARDLTVFREIAGPHAIYFSGNDPGALAEAIKSWLQLHKDRVAPSSGMKWLTWAENVERLKDFLASSDSNSPERPDATRTSSPGV